MAPRIALAGLALLLSATPAAAEERRYMLTGFESIRVEGPYEVTVTAGGAPGAVATGGPRSFDTVDVRVEGRTLIVRAGLEAWGGYPGSPKAAPRIAVTVPALRSATVEGGGRLTIDRMAGQRIDVRLTGAGAITVADARADVLDSQVIGTGLVRIAGTAQRARFGANGAGAIDATALTVGALTVDWLSVGEAKFTARYTAEVSSQGQGPVTIAGAAACKIAGTGPVTCGNVIKRR